MLYGNRGEAKAQQGDNAGAIADYDHAIAIHPEYPRAYANRADAKAQQGDNAGAAADYDLAIANRYPDDGDTYYNRRQARLWLAAAPQPE